MFLPPARDTSPRMQTIFASVRSRLVPGLAKRAYGEAKAAYESKDREAAHAAFQRTLELIDSLADADRAPLSDLRLLAGEFLELSAERPAAGPASPPDAAPARLEPPVEYMPPVAVREQLPVWIPPDRLARQSEYVGLLRILIGADGRVSSATIVKGSHPSYDVAAVTSAKQWLYKPATRGGQPVPSTKEIQVRLVPH